MPKVGVGRGVDGGAYLPTGGFQFNPDVQPKSLYQQQSVVAGLTAITKKSNQRWRNSIGNMAVIAPFRVVVFGRFGWLVWDRIRTTGRNKNSHRYGTFILDAKD